LNLNAMLKQYLELPRAVHILCLGTLVNKAGSFVLIFLMIYVSENLNLGPRFAAYCMGAFGVGSMVASLVGGHLADTYGRRVVMLTALFGGAVMLFLLSTLTHPAAFLIGLSVFALFVEMYRPAASAMIGDLVTADQRPRAFGLMYIAINLGFACGPPFGGLIASHSFKLLFWADGLTTAAYGLVVLLLIRETLPSRALSGQELPSDDSDQEDSSEPTISVSQETEADVDELNADIDGRSISPREAFRHIRRDKAFLLFCLSLLLTSVVFAQYITTFPMFMRSLGYSPFEFGMFTSINGILIFLCQLPLTHALARSNRIVTVMIGAVLIAIGFGLLVFAKSPLFLAATIVIWTCGEMLQAPFTHAIVNDLAPTQLRARYLGVLDLCFSLSLTIGAPLGGELFSRFGATTLWTTCLSIGLVAAIIPVFILRLKTNRLER
jgi:MFS family permease